MLFVYATQISLIVAMLKMISNPILNESEMDCMYHNMTKDLMGQDLLLGNVAFLRHIHWILEWKQNHTQPTIGI